MVGWAGCVGGVIDRREALPGCAENSGAPHIVEVVLEVGFQALMVRR